MELKEYLVEKGLLEQTHALVLEDKSDYKEVKDLLDDMNVVYKDSSKSIFVFNNDKDYSDVKDMLKVEKIKYKEV